MLPLQPERRAGCPVVAPRLHKIENAGCGAADSAAPSRPPGCSEPIRPSRAGERRGSGVGRSVRAGPAANAVLGGRPSPGRLCPGVTGPDPHLRRRLRRSWTVVERPARRGQNHSEPGGCLRRPDRLSSRRSSRRRPDPVARSVPSRRAGGRRGSGGTGGRGGAGRGGAEQAAAAGWVIADPERAARLRTLPGTRSPIMRDTVGTVPLMIGIWEPGGAS